MVMKSPKTFPVDHSAPTEVCIISSDLEAIHNEFSLSIESSDAVSDLSSVDFDDASSCFHSISGFQSDPESFTEQLSWKDIIQLLNSHPQSAQELLCDKLTDNKNVRLLHFVLHMRPPLEVVSSVVRAYPDAIYEQSDAGTALQIACQQGASYKLLSYLLRTHMVVLKRRMSTSKDSFLQSCANRNIISNPLFFLPEPYVSPRTAAFLLDLYPEGAIQLSISNEKGASNPLSDMINVFSSHFYEETLGGNPGDEFDSFAERCKINEGFEKLMHILIATQKKLGAPTVSKFRPIHTLLRYIDCPEINLRGINKDGIQAILLHAKERTPSELSSKDDWGMLPLQILVEKPYEKCQHLIPQSEARSIIQILSKGSPKKTLGISVFGRGERKRLAKVAVSNGWPC